MRAVSDTFKRAVFAQHTDEVFICLLTISHPSFDDDIRLASDAFELLPIAGIRGVVSRGEEYLFLPFELELPAQDDTGIARASIKVDNIDRRMVAAIRNADSNLSVTIEVVMSSDVDTPEVAVTDFRMERVKYDAYTLSGEISVEYYDLEPFPARRFTPSDFPGLF